MQMAMPMTTCRGPLALHQHSVLRLVQVGIVYRRWCSSLGSLRCSATGHHFVVVYRVLSGGCLLLIVAFRDSSTRAHGHPSACTDALGLARCVWVRQAFLRWRS